MINLFHSGRNAAVAFTMVTACLVAACGQEEPQATPSESKSAETRDTGRDADQNAERVPAIAQVPFAPGGTEPVREQSKGMRAVMDDPEQIAAGGQLYLAMNCVGCHSHGGGGMGPALIDDVWIYGGEIENIAASIREGRPAGMPAFRGFLPEEQIWQVAAFVKSMPAAADKASR